MIGMLLMVSSKEFFHVKEGRLMGQGHYGLQKHRFRSYRCVMECAFKPFLVVYTYSTLLSNVGTAEFKISITQNTKRS